MSNPKVDTTSSTSSSSSTVATISGEDEWLNKMLDWNIGYVVDMNENLVTCFVSGMWQTKRLRRRNKEKQKECNRRNKVGALVVTYLWHNVFEHDGKPGLPLPEFLEEDKVARKTIRKKPNADIDAPFWEKCNQVEKSNGKDLRRKVEDMLPSKHTDEKAKMEWDSYKEFRAGFEGYVNRIGALSMDLLANVVVMLKFYLQAKWEDDKARCGLEYTPRADESYFERVKYVIPLVIKVVNYNFNDIIKMETIRPLRQQPTKQPAKTAPNE